MYTLTIFSSSNVISFLSVCNWSRTKTPHPLTQLADDQSLKLFEVTHSTVKCALSKAFPAVCPYFIKSAFGAKALFQFCFSSPEKRFSGFAYVHTANSALWGVFDCIFSSHVQKYKVVRQQSTLRSIPLGKPWPIIDNCNTESEDLNGIEWVMGLVIIYIVTVETFVLCNVPPNGVCQVI